jgi:cold shock CspA family protein
MNVRQYDLTGDTSDKLTGEIMRWDFERAYGFIRCTSDPGLRNPFLHVSALVEKDDIERLEPGARVAFDVVDSPKGPRAVAVELLP